MSQSFLYRIHPENKILQSVKEINFSDANFKERYDIQEWVESTPSILGEDLLIIAKESSCFDGTRERPDLIALDKSGNVVIIELKRDDSGVNLEWQAIKYASYWSRFKPSDIARVYDEYLKRSSEGNDVTESHAEANIVDFIDENSITDINRKQRLILVSHRYAKEVTSAVHWLIDNYGVDIKCIQLIPFYDSDKSSYYLQSNVILPIAGIDELLIGASISNTTVQNRSAGPVRKDDEVTKFFEKLRDKVQHDISLLYKPSKSSRWAGVAGKERRYYHFWYDSPLWENWGMSYMIDCFSDKYDEDEEYRGKYSIYLSISRKHLLNKGVSEEAIKQLKTSLESFSGSYGVYDKDDYIYVEKLVDMFDMSENEQITVNDVLVNLINTTYPIIDNNTLS